ncbi:MAG: dehypoxanthine futalosine cyclase [Candidatus Auribacter fodinae]|jgi:cyclic dehypoxanthinyl futalosine synthase|uniref:Cyclic dehypoxanthine futalosine synthase n=1 Tax=Candidatus Auribacter fodinae TaxID=2093366 RepID=A0A3A4R9G2_9BACT|nr:MAG: dehypoxanthine futalosine cyclase [Candidatus Auribacter fodinae]
MISCIADKIKSGIRITDEECIALFDLELPQLGRLATAAKKRHHNGSQATFVVDIIINYTNVCTCKCKFCAFYVQPGDSRGYVLSPETIIEKIRNLSASGGTQVLLQGGINPALDLNYFTSLFRKIKEKCSVYLHCLSPVEIHYLSEKEQCSHKDILTCLRDAGLDSLPGGGAEILSDRVRSTISPNKISKDIWLSVMETAHSIGLKSTATMMFASIETREERVEHLRHIRNLQDRTGGFRAFIPWTFSPANTKLNTIIRAGGGEYLKLLAISRIYLDNIRHIGSGWLTEGMKVGQLGLLFGANDMGGIIMEEKVLRETGIANQTTIEELIETIRDAGFTPARRNTEYDILEVYA